MENASNALLITAGILIGVMIISLGTYLFMTFGNYSKNINDRLTEQQKEEFNAQFTKYQSTQDDETTYCTVYDIVTIINLARNENEKYEEYKNLTTRPANFNNDNNSYIYVQTDLTDINEKTETKKLSELIDKKNKQIEKTEITGEKYIDFEEKYKCKVNISDQTKLVKSIIFTKI